MDAEEIDAAAAAAELNILGGLASVTGLQSPAPTRPAGATANDASKDEASPIPSAPAAPSGVANDSPQGAVPATPSAVTITTEQLAMLGGIMAGDPETISTVRRIAQRKLEEELEYVETDSVYSYRL